MTARMTVEEYKASFYAGLEGVELTLDEIQHALRRAAVTKKALQKYVELVKEIPEVSEVRYDRDYDVVTAVFSEEERYGEAFDRLCEADVEVFRYARPVLLDFRSVNCYGYAPEKDFYDRFHIGGEQVWTR